MPKSYAGTVKPNTDVKRAPASGRDAALHREAIEEKSVITCDSKKRNDAAILEQRYQFAGTFTDPSQVERQAGLLAVLDATDEKIELIDLSESVNLRRSAQFSAISHRPQNCTRLWAVYYAQSLSSEELRKKRQAVLDTLNSLN